MIDQAVARETNSANSNDASAHLRRESYGTLQDEARLKRSAASGGTVPFERNAAPGLNEYENSSPPENILLIASHHGNYDQMSHYPRHRRDEDSYQQHEYQKPPQEYPYREYREIPDYDYEQRRQYSPLYDESRNAELLHTDTKPGFVAGLMNGVLRSSMQSPIDNIAQLIDHTVGKAFDTNLHEKTRDLVGSRMQTEYGSSAWHGQLAGEAIGSLPWLLLAHQTAKGVLGSFESTRGLLAEASLGGKSSFRNSFIEGAATGATYTGLFSAEADNDNYWSAKSRHLAEGAAMMGTFNGFNNSLGQALFKNQSMSRAMLVGAIAAAPAAAVETGLSHTLEDSKNDLWTDFKMNYYKDALVGAGFNGMSRFETVGDRINAMPKVELKPLETATQISEMPEGHVGWTQSWALKKGPDNALWISPDAVAGVEFNADPSLNNTLKVIRTENNGIAVDFAKMADPSFAMHWRSSSNPAAEGLLPVGLAMHPKGVFPFIGTQARIPDGYGEGINPALSAKMRTGRTERSAVSSSDSRQTTSSSSSNSGWGPFEYLLFWNAISPRVHESTNYNLGGGGSSSFDSNGDISTEQGGYGDSWNKGTSGGGWGDEGVAKTDGNQWGGNGGYDNNVLDNKTGADDNGNGNNGYGNNAVDQYDPGYGNGADQGIGGGADNQVFAGDGGYDTSATFTGDTGFGV